MGRFVENSNLLAHLPPGNEHRPDNQGDVGTVKYQSLNLPIERQSPHRAGQKTKCFEHPPDVIGQSRGHADELSPCAKKSTRAVAFERLDVNGPVPSRANDLSQSLRIVLIRLIDLHLKGSACMPGVETNDFEPEIAEFMHQPWGHRSGLDPYVGVAPRMPADQSVDLFWICGALAPP
jgi:hypothetical protein